MNGTYLKMRIKKVVREIKQLLSNKTLHVNEYKRTKSFPARGLRNGDHILTRMWEMALIRIGCYVNMSARGLHESVNYP